MKNKNFKKEQKYVYIKENKHFGILDKYRIVTFVCDREEKEEYIVELSVSMCRVLHTIPYKEKDNIVTLEEAILIVENQKENEIKKLEKYKNIFIPCVYKIQIYQKLKNEILAMRQKLEYHEYDYNRIFVIKRTIQQKEKGMRRIRKCTYKNLEKLNLKIEEIDLINYNKNLIERNILNYDCLLNTLYEIKSNNI